MDFTNTGFEPATRFDTIELRARYKADVAALRGELKSDIATLRGNLEGDIAELRIELKSDIADLERRFLLALLALATLAHIGVTAALIIFLD